jgi:hypothetical protein
MTLPGSYSASQERCAMPQLASTPDLAEPQLVRPDNTSPQTVPHNLPQTAQQPYLGEP